MIVVVFVLVPDNQDRGLTRRQVEDSVGVGPYGCPCLPEHNLLVQLIFVLKTLLLFSMPPSGSLLLENNLPDQRYLLTITHLSVKQLKFN